MSNGKAGRIARISYGVCEIFLFECLLVSLLGLSSIRNGGDVVVGMCLNAVCCVVNASIQRVFSRRDVFHSIPLCVRRPLYVRMELRSFRFCRGAWIERKTNVSASEYWKAQQQQQPYGVAG